MNLLRSTHLVEARHGLPVILELSHLDSLRINLLYSFIEAWLFQHCRSEWSLEHIEDFKNSDHANHVYFRIVFNDAKEAIYFKLSPFLLHNRPTVPLAFVS